MTGDGLTGCLNLATGDPCTLHGFDTKTTECKLISPLSVSFHAPFLHSPEFGFLRL
jgi:hypothetical protein